MAASYVPVVYNKLDKRVLRWAILDFDSQLSDPSFGTNTDNEAILLVPMYLYRKFAKGNLALADLQKYVHENAQ